MLSYNTYMLCFFLLHILQLLCFNIYTQDESSNSSYDHEYDYDQPMVLFPEDLPGIIIYFFYST